MAIFTLEDGIATVAFSVICALRMRVSMSAMGSVMFIYTFPQFPVSREGPPRPTCPLGGQRARRSLRAWGPSSPAGLDDAGNFAAHRELAQLVAAEAELAIHAARPAGERAAVADARRVGVARELLDRKARLEPRVVRGLGVLEDRDQRLALL